MKTIKVIDLLNKIANEDEIPEKIKYENYIYWYDKNWKDYKNAQVEFRSYLINSRYHNTDFLNEEVEIIEDTPKEKIDYRKIRYDIHQFDNIKEYLEIFSDDVYTKIENITDKLDEIIDKINGE